MKYMGSKSRIAKHILPIILENRTEGQYYVEPFVGGANVIDKVDGNRIGSDNSKYLISLWKGLQNNHPIIKEISKEIYDKARTDFNNGTNIYYTDFEIGFIGFMGSFNGRFFDGGYNGNYTKRDYTKESIDNLTNQIENIKGIEFYNCDYSVLQIPAGSIIYCDKPYQNTKQYFTSKNFEHDNFYQWCRDMKKLGHTIFVSEYEAPEDFICVWQKELKTCMNNKNIKTPIEKLFTL